MKAKLIALVLMVAATAVPAVVFQFKGLLYNAIPPSPEDVRLGTYSLKAFKDVALVVEDVPEELKGHLTTVEVELWARNKCTSAGLSVISHEAQGKRFSAALIKDDTSSMLARDDLFRTLHVSVNATITSTDTLIYNVTVSFDRSGFVSPGRFVPVTVESESTMGYAGGNHSPKETLRSAVESQVKDLLDKWKAANPTLAK